MRLLFDQNLSRRLVEMLSAEYPGSLHVADLGLDTGTHRVAVENFAGAIEEALLVLTGARAR